MAIRFVVPTKQQGATDTRRGRIRFNPLGQAKPAISTQEDRVPTPQEKVGEKRQKAFLNLEKLDF